MVSATKSVTLAYVVCHWRDQLLLAIQEHNDQEVIHVDQLLRGLADAIGAQYPDGTFVPALVPLEALIHSVQDYFHGVTWKSTIPSPEEIQAAFATHNGEPA